MAFSPKLTKTKMEKLIRENIQSSEPTFIELEHLDAFLPSPHTRPKNRTKLHNLLKMKHAREWIQNQFAYQPVSANGEAYHQHAAHINKH